MLTTVAADGERRALEDGGRYAAIVAVLAAIWLGARWRTSWLADGVAAPEFEDEPVDRVLSLDVWDARVTSRPDEKLSAR